MLAFSNDYYGLNFRAKQSVELFCAYVISVSDDGCGFKNIDIEKATLPFYKSSKDIATEHLGLGLNISKILSERHGGNIQIANNKAGGACVTVKINCNES